MSPRRCRQLLADGGLALLLLATIVAVTSLYVSRERVFYYYDLAGYHNTTVDLAARYRESPAAARQWIGRSLAEEYNALFTIPLLPFVLRFGESRRVYLTALAVVYLLPFVVALGGVAVRLLPGRPRAAFWGTVALALLTPATWLPTLRGYPDTGGAALLALAVWVCLRDPGLRRWWQIPAIGALLAAAMIFRRHFAYAAVAFLAAAALQQVARFARRVRQHPRAAWRDLLADGAAVGLTALATLLTLAFCDPAFIERALANDYTALYASYMQPPPTLLRWAAGSYGWVAWAGAAVGFAAGPRGRAAAPGAALFVALFGGLSLLGWSLVVRQPGPHYTLHFTLPVVLGLAALGRLIWRGRGRRGVRALALGIAGAWALANLAVGLGAAPVAEVGAPRPLVAAPQPPLARADYDAVARLIAALRELAPNREPIFIAASSETLSGDIALNAERALYGRADLRLAVLGAPEIDSRDFFPLEALLRARYVVVVEPFQHHLAPERQGVVAVVVELFGADREFARDFARLPDGFTLAGGAVATIYGRVRPTAPPVAARTLRLMQGYVGERPGGQPDWVALNPDGGVAVSPDRDEGYTVTLRPGRRDEPPTTPLLYAGTAARGVTVAGEVAFHDERCPGVALRFSRLDHEGRISPVAEVPRHPGDPAAFTVALPAGGAAELLLDLAPGERDDAPADCTLTVRRLTVTPEGGDGGGAVPATATR